jgi:hypothetical protein
MAPTLPTDDPRAADGAPIGSEGDSPMPARPNRQPNEAGQDRPRRDPKRRASAARVQAGPPRVTSCPVAALAEEAAALRRLILRLRVDSPTADQALIDRLLGSDDVAALGEMVTCHQRMDAVMSLASHRRAASAKGALFQLYLAAYKLLELGDTVRLGNMRGDDRDRFEEWREEVRRLFYSALGELETATLDDDLRLLRSWSLPPEFDVLKASDQLMGETPAS